MLQGDGSSGLGTAALRCLRADAGAGAKRGLRPAVNPNVFFYAPPRAFWRKRIRTPRTAVQNMHCTIRKTAPCAVGGKNAFPQIRAQLGCIRRYALGNWETARLRAWCQRPHAARAPAPRKGMLVQGPSWARPGLQLCSRGQLIAPMARQSRPPRCPWAIALWRPPDIHIARCLGAGRPATPRPGPW